MGRLLTAIDPQLGRSAGSVQFTTSEQVYYLGAPLAHVVAYEQRLREIRLARYTALAAPAQSGIQKRTIRPVPGPSSAVS